MSRLQPSPKQSRTTHADGSPILLEQLDAKRSQVVWILVLAAAGMFALLSLLPATGHDQMWLLYSARLVSQGKTLYGPELFESNPPLIIWLSRLPVALAHLFPGGEAFYLKLLTLIAGTVSAWWNFSFFRRATTQTISRTTRAWLFFSFIVLFGAATARDFAQRDHLLVLLCLPYVASIACRARRIYIPGWEAALIGISAAVGISLKPHQALLVLALESFLFAKRRSVRSLLRPEPFLVVTLGVAYLIAARTLTPAYFTTIIPLLRDCYWAFGNRSFLQLIGDAPQLHILGLIAIFLWRKHKDLPVTVLLLAGIAATLAYYLQGTGWYYQQLPAIGFFGLALALELLPILEGMRLPRHATALAATLAVIALFCTTHAMNYPFTSERNFVVYEPDASLLAQLPPHTPVYAMTTDLDLTIPAITKYNLTWASRMPHMWMLPAILRAEAHDPSTPKRLTPQRIAELDAIQHRIVAEDIERWQPEYIFIHRCYAVYTPCQELDGRKDDLERWFDKDPRFRRAMSHYMTEGAHMSFDVYKRMHFDASTR